VGLIVDAVSGLWLLLGAFAWGLGALGAGVRHDLVTIERGHVRHSDYALLSRLKRLHDEPVTLGLRLRFSRFFAAVFVPLGLAGGVLRLSWGWVAAVCFLGWLVAALTEAAGGTRMMRRLGRGRGGVLYGVWARLVLPAARVSRPLLPWRAGRVATPLSEGVVNAETRAALAGAGGRLGREERRLLRRLLASTSILVADVMTRWDAVRTLEDGLSPEDARARARASGHSRLPVVAGGRVVGLITVKDLLPYPITGPEPPLTLRERLRPAYFVRQEETIQDLLDELREARVHLAVVVDRLGRRVGIVTVEDVLEEIVGELHDERERERGVRA
jgi:CBS domain-containing protein